jgi:phage gp29-like protein
MYTVNGVRLDVASMLARKLQKIVQRRIIRPMADLNWGGRIMSDITFPVQAVEDLVQQINVDVKLMQQISGSEAHLRDKYSFPAPSDDEDTVRPRRGLGGLGV